jgi:tetratricopeptide (TPR) repeat protein
VSSERKGSLTLGPSFTREENSEITTGSYALLLMLAETEARRLPQQALGEHHQHVRQALALLDRADGLGMETRAIHLCRARYLNLLGDAAAAREESERAKALATKTDLDPQDHFLVGHELYSRGELEPANAEFRRALQLNPRHFWTHYYLGICYITSGKSEVAVAHFTICQSQQPALVWIYLLRGFALGQLQEYHAAEADFDRALALEPTSAARYVLFNNRGVMRVGQKESWAKGVEDLQQAAALRPDQYQPYVSLAEAYRLNNQLEEAAKHLDKALRLAQRQVEAGDIRPTPLARLHYSRARLHLERKNREAAIRALAETARLAENDRALQAKADGDRGRVLHLQERFGQALAAYDEALKADPSRVEILRWRGEVLLVQRRYAEAGTTFDDYLKKGGTPSAAMYRQRGLVHAKLGQHLEAIDDFGRALDAQPKAEEKPLLYLSRGQIYLPVNALRPALRDFEEARRLDHNSADAALGCAFARVKLGDTEKGLADAAAVVKGDPKEPRVWHGAARIYALAVALLKPEEGQEGTQTKLRNQYQQEAIKLLRKALQLVAANQRQAYWREQVRKDAGLSSLRSLPEYRRLAAEHAEKRGLADEGIQGVP